VRPSPEAWVLPEVTVPESTTHHAALHRLTLLLEAWIAWAGRNAYVARNLACRWLEHAPLTGVDPDLCLLEPPPPGVDRLGSLCTWKAGHVVPRLCVEVVSENHPYKDYALVQDRYASLGTRELVVFDPLLVGPPSLGGPVPFQVWRRDDAGAFARVHFGDGPAYSAELGAWLHPRDLLLDVADDREGRARWLMNEERERSEKERERGEKERERAARIAAERRIAELEGKLRTE